MSTLGISCRAKGNGSSSPRKHGIVMLLMRLHICSKFKLTVVGIVDSSPQDDGSWTQSVRDTTTSREAVQPKDTIVNKLNDHACWIPFKRQHGDDAASAFLDGANVTLNFWDVFLC